MVHFSSIVIAKRVINAATKRFKVKKACKSGEKSRFAFCSSFIVEAEAEKQELDDALTRAIMDKAREIFKAELDADKKKEESEKKNEDERAQYLAWWLSLSERDRAFRERRQQRLDHETEVRYEQRFFWCEKNIRVLDAEFTDFVAREGSSMTFPRFVCYWVLDNHKWGPDEE
jgi:hypothetical protein